MDITAKDIHWGAGCCKSSKLPPLASSTSRSTLEAKVDSEVHARREYSPQPQRSRPRSPLRSPRIGRGSVLSSLATEHSRPSRSPIRKKEQPVPILFVRRKSASEVQAEEAIEKIRELQAGLFTRIASSSAVLLSAQQILEDCGQAIAKWFGSLSGPALEAAIKDEFNKFDLDVSGFLDRQEFARVMHNIGLRLGNAEFDVLFKGADIDENGQIDFPEFSHMILKHLKKACRADCRTCEHTEGSNQPHVVYRPRWSDDDTLLAPAASLLQTGLVALITRHDYAEVREDPELFDSYYGTPAWRHAGRTSPRLQPLERAESSIDAFDGNIFHSDSFDEIISGLRASDRRDDTVEDQLHVRFEKLKTSETTASVDSQTSLVSFSTFAADGGAMGHTSVCPGNTTWANQAIGTDAKASDLAQADYYLTDHPEDLPSLRATTFAHEIVQNPEASATAQLCQRDTADTVEMKRHEEAEKERQREREVPLAERRTRAREGLEDNRRLARTKHTPNYNLNHDADDFLFRDTNFLMSDTPSFSDRGLPPSNATHPDKDTSGTFHDRMISLLDLKPGGPLPPLAHGTLKSRQGNVLLNPSKIAQQPPPRKERPFGLLLNLPPAHGSNPPVSHHSEQNFQGRARPGGEGEDNGVAEEHLLTRLSDVGFGHVGGLGVRGILERPRSVEPQQTQHLKHQHRRRSYEERLLLNFVRNEVKQVAQTRDDATCKLQIPPSTFTFSSSSSSSIRVQRLPKMQSRY